MMDGPDGQGDRADQGEWLTCRLFPRPPPARGRNRLLRLVVAARSHHRRDAGARRLFRGGDRHAARHVGFRRGRHRHRHHRRRRRSAPIVRMPYHDWPMVEPRARHGRRGRGRAADQHRRGRKEVRVGRQVSAGRRPQLGTQPRHHARRIPRHEILLARCQRHDRHHRHDRDARGHGECRRDCRGQGHRRAVRRPIRSFDHHDATAPCSIRIKRYRGRARQDRGGGERRPARWRGFIARPASARRRWPSAASAISRSATTSASCARASRRT